MKTVIWDLDGTIIDSYKVIVPSVCEAVKKYGIELSDKFVSDYIIKYSCGDLFSRIAEENGLNPDDIKKTYSGITHTKDDTIGLIPNAKKILEILYDKGIQNIIYTHRGESTDLILKNNKIDMYFTDIINSTYHLKRKPDPEGLNYILDKHKLDINDVYYVGDRSIDMECAKRANVCGILMAHQSSGYEKYLIKDLLEIEKIVVEK